MECKATIKFTDDYLQARFSEEAKEGLKKNIIVRGAKLNVPDPDIFLHKDEKGCYVPSEQIEGALAQAAKDFKMKSSRKSLNNEVKANVYVKPDRIYLETDKSDDVLVSYPKRKDGSRVTLAHPLFKEGREINFALINLAEKIIDRNTLREILIKAGNSYGIGARRPKWGKFEVLQFE